MAFVNRFVTETDERVRNDCTVCSTLMTVGFGTRDIIYDHADGTVLTAAEVKALREKIRVRTGDVEGGTSIEDCIKGLEATYPWLDLKCEHLTQSQIETRWKAGYAGTVQGNPSAVTNTGSGLRRWTVNDDYGHAIKAGPMHSDGLRVWIQDPMGHGTYRGQWVPLTEIRQFMKAMRRADGTNHTLLVREGDYLSAVTTIEKTNPPRSFAVPAGNRKIGYTMDATTGRYKAKTDKTLTVPLTGTAHAVSIKQYPTLQKPTGASIFVVAASDPAYNGTVLSIAAVTLGPTPTPGGITQAQLDAAVVAATAAGVKTGFSHAIEAVKSAISTLHP